MNLQNNTKTREFLKSLGFTPDPSNRYSSLEDWNFTEEDTLTIRLYENMRADSWLNNTYVYMGPATQIDLKLWITLLTTDNYKNE